MLSRSTSTSLKATVAIGLLLLSFTGCHHPAPPPRTAPPPAPATAPAPAAPPKVTYNEAYDPQIKEIMDLAHHERWEEAQAKADELFKIAPQNVMVQRVHGWVLEARQKRREQALEDKIREIDAKDSVFNPTLPGLVKEQKDRGLLNRKDVRDAVDQIENAPYIPDTYNKTIHKQGPLFDFESTKGRMAKVLERKVTIHLDNVPLETVLVNLSQSAGVNIVAEEHAHYKRTVDWRHESGFRYVFHHQEDKNREFLLNVLVFDIPIKIT